MSHLNFRITSGIRTVWFGLLWIALALTSAKADPVLYAGYEDSENNFQQHFGTLDPITGSFTDIATEPVQLDGLGFAPDGIMYATDVNNVVYQVDPATGQLTEIGTSPYSIGGSTVGPDGLIYVISAASKASFYTINPLTMATHVINSNVGFISSSLAVLSGGLFYTVDALNEPEVLYSINPTTGAVTKIGTGLGSRTADVDLSAAANVNGTVYGMGGPDSNYNEIYTINTTTGKGTYTNVSATDTSSFEFSWDILAYDSASPTPEPASAPLMAAGLAALCVAKFYRSRCASQRSAS